MAFKDWLKEYRESQSAKGTNSVESSETTFKTSKKSTSGSSVGGNSGAFRSWLAEYREKQSTGSVEGWAEASINLLNDTKERTAKWFDSAEQESLSSRYTSLLAQADGWRKQHTGNNEALAYIDSVADALSKAKGYTWDRYQAYSKWKSAEEYDKDIQNQKEYEELLDFDTDFAEKEIKSMEQALAGYGRLAEYYHMYQANPEAYSDNESVKKMAATYEQYQQMFGSQEDLEKRLHDTKLKLSNAKRLQEGVRLSSVADRDSEFDKYSGYVSTEFDDAWSKLWSQYGMGYDDLTYEYINGGQSGMREEIIRKNIVYNADGDSLGDTLDWKVYDHMTEDEISIYNYYYAKHGKEAAENYLDYLKESLNYRVAEKRFGSLKDNTVLELIFGVEAGLDQFESGVKNLLNTSDNYVPATSTQMVSGMVREDLADDGVKLPEWMGGASLGQVGYDAITTTTNMAPSILTATVVGTINPAAGTAVGNALMGASAAGNAYQEALNLGYNKEQARAYSTLIGASEVGLQYLMGGIGKLGGKLSGKAVASLASKFDSAYARLAVQYGSNMLSEGAEEYLQEILTPVFKNVALGTDEEIELITEGAIYSFLLGAVTSGFMEGTGISSENGKGLVGNLLDMSTKNQANVDAVNLYGSSIKELIDEGLASETGSKSHQFAEVMKRKTDKGRSVSGYEIRQLVETNETQFAAEDSNTAEEQQNVLNQATQTDRAGKLFDIPYQSSEGQSDFSKASRTNSAEQSTEIAATEGNLTVSENVAAERALESPAQDDVTYQVSTGKAVKPRKVTQINGKQAMVEVDSGDVVAADDIEFGTEDEDLLWRTTLSIQNITPTAANTIIQTAKLSNMPSSTYTSSAAVVFQNGYHNAQIDPEYGGRLTDVQRDIIYEAGQLAAQENTAKEQAKREADSKAQALDTKIIKSTNSKAVRKRGTVKGEGVTISDLKKTFNNPQGKAYNYLSVVAEVTGIDIVLYRSKTGPDGKFQGAQGRYSRRDPGTIYIDLNAGLTDIKSADDLAKYAMLRTFAHEFTHFIENWNPIQYNELRKVVLDTLTERGENVHGLIEDKQVHNPGMSYDKASREVVAEAMTDILPDANFVQELSQKHKNIFTKLLEKLKEFVQNLRDYFNSIGHNRSREANALKEQVGDTIKYLDSIVRMFEQAAVQAVENYQAATDGNQTNTNADTAQEQSREYLDEHVSITMGMTETERYEILKDRRISVTAKTNAEALRSAEEKIGQKAENAILLTETDRKKLFVKIGKEFGVFKEYSNTDVKLTFNFSRGNLRESVGKQRKNYSDFAKMLSCFDKIIDAAIGIEVHNRNDEGYKPDPTLKSVYVLVSAFEDGSNIVPVKLEIKEFVDKDNTLYVAIALESIKKDEVVKQGNTENGVTQNSRSSIIKIADLFSKINPSDTSFLKYVPSQFLTISDKVEQNQQRTDTLTDRDILAIAEKRGITETLSAGQVGTLQTFNKKNAEVGELLKQKAKQEKILEDLQGTAKPDKQEIIKTQNRIKIIESQIRRESAKLREYEARDSVKGILEKVKPAVEKKLIEERKKELAKYGTIPKGEKAVRESNLPQSTDGKNKVSRTARTVYEAGVTPEDFAELIDKEVYLKNNLTYLPVKNNAATKEAMEYIQQEGWVAARYRWSADVRRGVTNAKMSAMGALLLNNAAKAGDRTAWLEILADYRLMGTRAAQATQALRILKTLAPTDTLYMVEKSVEKMVRDLHLEGEVEIDQELIKAYKAAETDNQRDAILTEIQKNIAKQLPSTMMEMWTALRYVNMLGNFKTQIRNVFGNATMMLTNRIKNIIATGLEALFYKASKGNFKRTKSLRVGKDLLRACKADFAEIESLALDGGKYVDAATSRLEKGIRDEKRVFKTPDFVKNERTKKIVDTILTPMEKYRQVTTWAMEQGDLLFSRSAYARALGGYLKANGVKNADLSKCDEALLDEARMYAIKEAQEVTFRDHNALTEILTSKLEERSGIAKVVNKATQGIMPFRQTPANVLLRAEEYSPLGFVNALVLSFQAAVGKSNLTQKKGLVGEFAKSGQDITGAQLINSLSKSLTGTGLFLAGMILSNLGAAIGGADEDDKEEAFDKLHGKQNFSLKICGVYYTLDWLSPSAIPFFMGVNLMEQVHENGRSAEAIKDALMSLTEPMLQMSMLQGLNDTLDEVRYSANSPLLQLGENALFSYAVQGMTNSLLSQLERGFEDKRFTTYVDKNSSVDTDLQKKLGKNSAKIPGWDYNQIPYINAWGEEEENPGTLVNLAYNMFSPGYFSKDSTDDVAKELYRLNEVNEEERGVFPKTPEKTATFTDRQGTKHKDYDLSADEYVALAKEQGQTQRRIVEELFGSKEYKALTDEQKVKAVHKAYDYAREYAQIEVLDRDGFSAKWMTGIEGKEAQTIIQRVLEK